MFLLSHNRNSPIALLYTNNERSEREIRETIPFTIAPKIIKYLGENLPKETKNLHSENNKALMKEIEEKILARKEELKPVISDDKDAENSENSGMESVDGGSSVSSESGGSDDNILADIDEDFEEFTPAEE